MNERTRRAPRGYTYDACPGCEQDCYPSARRSNGVCGDCATILRNHALRETERAAAGHDAPVMHRVSWAPHGLPYLSEKRSHGERPIQTGFWNLMRAASEHEDAPQFGLNGAHPILFRPAKREVGSVSAGEGRLIKPSVAKALGALFDAVRAGLNDAYAEGKEDGQKLLIGLNDGSLSLKDFETRRG